MTLADKIVLIILCGAFLSLIIGEATEYMENRLRNSAHDEHLLLIIY